MKPTGIASWTESALGFIYPAFCQLCGTLRATAGEGYVCTACFKRVRFVNLKASY